MEEKIGAGRAFQVLSQPVSSHGDPAPLQHSMPNAETSADKEARGSFNWHLNQQSAQALQRDSPCGRRLQAVHAPQEFLIP